MTHPRIATWLGRWFEWTVPTGTPAETRNVWLDVKIDATDLSARAKSACCLFGVETVGQLTEIDAEELYLAKNVGVVTVREVRMFLGRAGLALKWELPDDWPPMSWRPSADRSLWAE